MRFAKENAGGESALIIGEQWNRDASYISIYYIHE